MKYNGVVISISKNEVKVTFCQKKNLLYNLEKEEWNWRNQLA